jgi:Holliday junction resolvase-like predicted endonuclease
MRFGKKVDSNHAEIRQLFRELGYKVIDTSQQGFGALDLQIVHNNRIYFVEVKSKYGKLNKRQSEFILYNENAVVVRDKDDVTLFRNNYEALRKKSVELAQLQTKERSKT